MTPRRLLPALTVVAALSAAGLAPTANAAAPGPFSPTVISVEQNDTPIDGWSGWLIWSRRQPDGTYALVARTPQGAGVQLPVTPQAAPIDASIGPGPTGGPLVVYTVCAKQLAVPTGCDVRRLDPLTGADAPVASASSPDVDERYPSVWGTQVAFSRSQPGAPGRAGVAVAPLDGAAPTRPTFFGPRSAHGSVTSGYGPQGIDLRGTDVAVAWRLSGSVDRWSLLVRRGTAKPRTVVAATTNRRTISRLGRPVLAAKDVVAPRLQTGALSRSELVRSTLSGSRTWTLGSGFTAAQTERYGSALSAVTRTGPSDLVVVRRLASDGRWSCKHPSLPTGGGCELLSLNAAAQPWRRVRP